MLWGSIPVTRTKKVSSEQEIKIVSQNFDLSRQVKEGPIMCLLTDKEHTRQRLFEIIKDMNLKWCSVQIVANHLLDLALINSHAKENLKRRIRALSCLILVQAMLTQMGRG